MSHQHQHEQDEDRSVTRLQNRALRTTTRKLRRVVRHLQEKADEIFMAVCTTVTEPERAFGELWGSANFDCGPEDYDYMVEKSIEAFAKVALLEARIAELQGAQTQSTTGK